jgi:hypothetical protein
LPDGIVLIASTPPLFSSLQSFSLAAGRNPQSALVKHSSGNLYGTTQGGGVYLDGSVFELSGPNYTTFTTLISFSGSSGNYQGSYPQTAPPLPAASRLVDTPVNLRPALPFSSIAPSFGSSACTSPTAAAQIFAEPSADPLQRQHFSNDIIVSP